MSTSRADVPSKVLALVSRRAWPIAALVVLAATALVWQRRRAPTLDAPRPEPLEDDIRVPELPLSTLEVPVVYELSPVVEKLEQVIPSEYGSLGQRMDVDGEDGGVEAAFELARSPLESRLEGTTAHVSALIHYRGRVWYDPPLLPEISASCGTDEDESAPRAWIALAAPLALTPDWTLDARPRVESVRPASDTDRDRCEITPLQFDITGRVVDAARQLLIDSLPAIRREVAAVDVRSRFEEWWQRLSEPISLGEDWWLVLDPVGVHRGHVSGEGLTLRATVGVVARPRIVLGRRPEVAVRPLPPLDSADLRPGLRVRASARAEYDVGSKHLDEALRGREVLAEGRALRVEGVEVSGIGGGRLAVEVRVGGAARGRLFLVGEPSYDASTAEVYVPDLDFEVATRDLLVGPLAWMAGAALIEVFRSEVRWPVSDVVAFAARQLDRGLNHSLGDRARLRGAVDEVEILGVYPTREALLVHASARAHAMLLVEDEPGGPADSHVDSGDRGGAAR